MANTQHLVRLEKGVDVWNEWRKLNRHVKIDLSSADLGSANLRLADLRGVNLRAANLRRTDLSGALLSEAGLRRAELRYAKLVLAQLRRADLRQTSLFRTDLRRATLANAELQEANLTGAILSEANLSHANLSGATLIEAQLRNTDLSGADLSNSDLTAARLNESDLTGADLRSASLQHTILAGARVTDIKLWESQRAGWYIKGIICERAYWDKGAGASTRYAQGEFEKLYSDQTCIELFYEGGVSTFELNTLPALLHHLVSLHPGVSIRLKSIEETGGGAKISISVSDAALATTERVKADAIQLYEAQLALREKESERLQIERDYIERLFIGKLIPAMLAAGAPQNVFNAPVTGVVISSGESKVDFRLTINDNPAILALLEKMIDRRADLGLPAADATKLETELRSATAELQKTSPDESVLSRSIGFIQMLATEAVKGAVGKIGESAVADWQVWLHQLGQLVGLLK